MLKLLKTLFSLSLLQFECVNSRYIEGVLNTNEKWAFLARFCFLSEEGQFEYQIEYNEDKGDLNLLLYYDTNDQWPAVYKSNKTCEERENVLNIGQNQIVNLTTKYRFKDYSGCGYMQEPYSTAPTFKMSLPTLPMFKTTKKKGIKKVVITTLQSFTDTNVDTTTEGIQREFSSDDFSGTTQATTTVNGYTTVPYSHDYLHTLNIPKTSLTINKSQETNLEQIPSNFSKNKQIVKRSVYYNRPKMISCHNARRFKSSRERWWFIAISNCQGTQGIHVKYRILMTNGPIGDYWHEHFSADEFYILPVLMAFTIAYCFLQLAIVMCSVELKSRQLLHTTYKIFLFSVVLQLFGILLVSGCYLKLAVSGLADSKVRRAGLIFMGASETTFLLLLLLLAKGYTVTRGRLPLPASVKLTIFMCLYSITYISIFIYEAEVFDPGEVLYLYESPAGYGLIILRILAWCMFVYSTIFTLKHYPEKGNFYYPFNIFGTIWFIAGPAFIISANTYIDKWVRESVVCAVLLFISFGGHLMFLLLTMPSVANKNFPYHVRTTQIGIMEVNGNAGTNTIEQFGHHPYEPGITIREQTVIIPLTRRTEEIFEDMYNQRLSARNGNANVSNEIANNSMDTAVENVLKWSVVKNVPAITLPNFERHGNRSSSGSDNSRITDNSNSFNFLSRSPSYNPKDTSTSKFEDYVKEVPIDLFTVSKMVVTTNNVKKKDNRNNIDDID